MLTQFFTIGLLMLLSAMLPGPDFALVTKNSILHSRRAGLFTSLGIGSAILVHITYCVLGLAVIISQSLLLFSVIKERARNNFHN
jgi:threonine/homoserine/homoserine lactone efflux protein